MSLAIGIPLLECVYVLGCARWVWRRCLYTGELDSEEWMPTKAEEFEPVPRMCRYILAVYEQDLANPEWAPPGGYRMKPENVLKKVQYADTKGNAPPYLLYLDHDHRDIVLAIRGLNLGKESDYAMLLDNSLGKQMFDGGYVHNGLLKAAAWLLNQEGETLKGLIGEYPDYTVSIAGHSLGAGVASLATLVIASNRDRLGKLSRKRLRAFALAPPRCMSLNLAVRHADVINSVILQDDFLPRTSTPLEDIFSSLFCLPCLLCFRCLRDTCISEERMFKDPRRLYVPGRVYHVVERKFCSCGRGDPVVKCDIPVKGRFEHVVLSCNATSDHSIICIERECQRALELMEEDMDMEAPQPQKIERQQSTAEEHKKAHKTALETAVSLKVPFAFSPSYGTFDSDRYETDSSENAIAIGPGEASGEFPEDPRTQSVNVTIPGATGDFEPNERHRLVGDSDKLAADKAPSKTNWDDVINRLFTRTPSGKLVVDHKQSRH